MPKAFTNLQSTQASPFIKFQLKRQIDLFIESSDPRKGLSTPEMELTYARKIIAKYACRCK